MTPGRLASDPDARVSWAPHDGHFSASASGRTAEHQGQWISDVLIGSDMRALCTPARWISPLTWLVRHSHSIVAGGLLLMSYTTRLTPGTSLTIRELILPRTS